MPNISDLYTDASIDEFMEEFGIHIRDCKTVQEVEVKREELQKAKEVLMVELTIAQEDPIAYLHGDAPHDEILFRKAMMDEVLKRARVRMWLYE